MLTNINKEEVSRKRTTGSRMLKEMAETTYREMVIEGSSEESSLESSVIMNNSNLSGMSNGSKAKGCSKGAFMKKLFEASVSLSNQIE